MVFQGGCLQQTMSKEDIEIFVIRIYNNSRDIPFAVKYRNTCIFGE